MREIITLQCNDCKNRNYTTTKNKKKHTDRMETKKFCNTCRNHTVPREVKEREDGADRIQAINPAAAGGLLRVKGSRFNGRPPVSKTGCGGSIPSSPARPNGKLLKREVGLRSEKPDP